MTKRMIKAMETQGTKACPNSGDGTSGPSQDKQTNVSSNSELSPQSSESFTDSLSEQANASSGSELSSQSSESSTDTDQTSEPSQDEQASAPSNDKPSPQSPQCAAKPTESTSEHACLLQNTNQRILQMISEITNGIDEEWEKATKRIEYLEAELDECHTQIFNSLPADGVSDTWIMEEYALLQDNLSNWLEGLPEIYNFAFQIKKYDIAVKDWKLFPEGPAAAQPEILTHLMFEFIFVRVFGTLIFGAHTSDLRLLESLLQGLKREKDHDTISLWKSDTVRAYTSRQGYEDQFRERCYKTTKAACGFMSYFSFMENYDRGRKFDRFIEQIAKPAAGLAVKMSCSPEQYRWDWYDDSMWFIAGIVTKRDLNRFTIVDVLSHQSVRMARFEALPDDAKIGNLLTVMYPAPFRCGKKGEMDIQIQKAVILVHVTVDEDTKGNITSPDTPEMEEIKEDGLDKRAKKRKMVWGIKIT